VLTGNKATRFSTSISCNGCRAKVCFNGVKLCMIELDVLAVRLPCQMGKVARVFRFGGRNRYP
jgi:hypothetical protein